MVCYYPDQGSASDQLCSKGNLLHPIRGSAQVWVVTHHQMTDRILFSARISGLLPLFFFAGKPVLTLQNVGCFLRLNITELEVFYSCIFFSITVGSDEVVIQSSSSTVVSFTSGSSCSFLGHLTLKVCIINFQQSFY